VSNNYIYTILREEFKERPLFKREELLDFFRQYEPELNEGTFTWRIYDLKKRNIISDVRKGVYTLSNQQKFELTLTRTIKSISRIIRQQYDADFYSIWDTNCLNEFIELQPTTAMVVLEVEKGFLDSVFFTLKDNGYKEVFIKPDENLIEKYVPEANQPIIIKPFLSRSPVQTVEGITVPALEKILVDIYCDDLIYYAFQGNQLLNIYRNAASKYSLNFSKLFNYAKRRSRKEEIKSLFFKVLNKDLKSIIE